MNKYVADHCRGRQVSYGTLPCRSGVGAAPQPVLERHRHFLINVAVVGSGNREHLDARYVGCRRSEGAERYATALQD